MQIPSSLCLHGGFYSLPLPSIAAVVALLLLLTRVSAQQKQRTRWLFRIRQGCAAEESRVTACC
jgi:hypothetical protein